MEAYARREKRHWMISCFAHFGGGCQPRLKAWLSVFDVLSAEFISQTKTQYCKKHKVQNSKISWLRSKKVWELQKKQKSIWTHRNQWIMISTLTNYIYICRRFAITTYGGVSQSSSTMYSVCVLFKHTIYDIYTVIPLSLH